MSQPRIFALAGGAAIAFVLSAPAASAQIHFSIDWKGPTIAMPDGGGGVPITEADILRPVLFPTFGPLPTPAIAITGGPGLPGLFLAGHAGCVGHPPGTPCGVEVDALSFGRDGFIQSGVLPGAPIWFSVDRWATGLPGAPAPPAVWTEGGPIVGDGSADMFMIPPLPGPMPLPCASLTPPPGHSGVLDGNGLYSASGHVYPGLGLIEPNLPLAAIIPAPGDNLDAFNLEQSVLPVLPTPYFSLDAGFPDPLTGIPNSGSAAAHGVSAGAILVPSPFTVTPAVWAPAPALGLDLVGFAVDDLDALAIRENGNGVFDPSLVPFDWLSGATDMVVFSVRRGSAVIGMPDSLCGKPIEAGDLLVPPSPVGVSPFPGVLVPAEMLALATVRSGTAAVHGDDIDALDFVDQPLLDCNMNGREDSLDIAFGPSSDSNRNGVPDECEQNYSPYCFCTPALSPCLNPDPSAGCRNSTGVGGLLSASGTTSIISDDLVLTASQLPPNEFGLFYMGPIQITVPFGDGLRCVGAGLTGTWRFLPPTPSTVTGVSQLGPGIVNYANTNFAAGGNILPGQTWNFQDWYRDPLGPCGSSFNLTNGMEVAFTP